MITNAMILNWSVTPRQIMIIMHARDRVAEMEFNEVEEAFIWANTKTLDRLNWLLTASRAEIKAWIDANY